MRFNDIVLLSLFVMVLAACSKETASGDSAAPAGRGGSLARFTVSGNYLYLADYNTLEVYDITSPAAAVKVRSVPIGFGVETLYPYGDKLFIGAQEGMYIYSLAVPDNPQKLGEARHVRTCDPVVANDTTAYVTLRGSGNCGAATDGLYTYDIKTITAPVQKSLLPLSTPYGLGLQDTVVFICRSTGGLTAVNVKAAAAPKEMYTLKDGDYMDVIPYGDVLICYVRTGIILYDMTNLNSLVRLSTFNY